MILLVSKKDFSVSRFTDKIETWAQFLKTAREEVSIVVRVSLNEKLVLEVTDPEIETGDHFNVGVSIDRGQNPIFFGYSGMKNITARDIEDGNYWKGGILAFLTTIDKVEKFLDAEIGYHPKIGNLIISNIS